MNTKTKRRINQGASLCVALILSSGMASPSRAGTRGSVDPEDPTATLSHAIRQRPDCAGLARPLDPHESLTLHLAFFNGAGLSATVESTLKQEAREIFAGAGVRLEWIAPASLTAEGQGYALKVIMLDLEPARWNVSPNAMGAVLGRRSPATAVYLFAPVIRRTLDPSGRRPLPASWLGRAFGKVLVHELVHALAPDLPHARSGLMAASQHRNTLQAIGRRLDPASVAALRRELLRVRNRDAVAETAP